MEILGMIDTLESMILDSPKIPFTGRTVINESDVLSVIDRIRLVLQSGVNIKETMNPKRTETQVFRPQESVEPQKAPSSESEAQSKAMEIIQQAYQMAAEIKSGANKYADEVLASLEATADRTIRTVKNGRLRLTKMQGNPLKEESA